MLTISIMYNGANYAQNIKGEFYERYQPSWFDSELTRRFIEDIDKMKHVADDIFRDRWGKAVAATCICGGSKALCLMQHTDLVVRASACGENCAKYISEIANLKDLHINLTYGMNFPDPFTAYITNIDRVVHSNYEWIETFIDLKCQYLSNEN